MIQKLILVIFLLSFSTAAFFAQTNPEQALIKAREQVSDIKKRSVELERIKREAGKRSISENLTLKFPEIKEDFEQIQKISFNVHKLTTDKTTINYLGILKSVSEIKRRAERLRSNLFTTDPEENNVTKKDPQNTDEIRDIKILIDDLNKAIDSFVHSSIFQNINLVNSNDSVKAQKDLENVIIISALIKAKSKKLADAEQKK